MEMKSYSVCRKPAVCSVFMMCFLFAGTQAGAATINVASAAQFNSALSSVQPGDTILLSGNIASASVFTTKNSGTAAAPITITGDGTAVITGENSGYGVNITNDYYRLSNFTIKNFGKGLVIGGTTAGSSGNHGIVDNVHVMDIQQEGFKIRTSSKYWLFTNCSARRTGQQSSSPKYGEGFYVGQAHSNWIGGTPDECAYVTFYNCYTLDTYNDGWDMKEGSHHVKVINCTADFSGTVEPPLKDSVGDAGFFNRGDNCQYIKCAVKSLDNGAHGFDFGRYSTYGSNHEIKQSGVILGNASFANILSAVTGVKIYNDYTFTSTGSFWMSGSATVSFSDPAGFIENTWTGEGGGLYGNLNSSIGSNGDPLNPGGNTLPSLTPPASLRVD